MKKIFSFIAGVAAAMTLQAANTEAVQIVMSCAGGPETQKVNLFVDPAQATADTKPNLASTYELGQVNLYVANECSEYKANAISNLPLAIVTNRRDVSYTFTFNAPIATEGLVLTDLRSVDGIKHIAMTNGDSYTFSVGEADGYVANTNVTIADRFVINYVAPTPDYGSYQRNVTNGNYGTICLPKNGVITGAALFEVAYRDANTIYCDEILSGELVAGRPYIFQASADQIVVNYSDADAAIAVSDQGFNGLHGFYNLDDEDAYKTIDADVNNCVLYNNQYYYVVSGHAARINNYFAYIAFNEVSTTAPNTAPGRRRIAMTVNGEQTATGIDALNAADAPVKTVIDGKIYIIRGEHMFDATGRMVK